MKYTGLIFTERTIIIDLTIKCDNLKTLKHRAKMLMPEFSYLKIIDNRYKNKDVSKTYRLVQGKLYLN